MDNREKTIADITDVLQKHHVSYFEAQRLLKLEYFDYIGKYLDLADVKLPPVGESGN